MLWARVGLGEGDGTNGPVTVREVGEAPPPATTLLSRAVMGQDTVRQCARCPGVGKAAPAARGVPAPEREPCEREGPRRGNLQKAEKRGTDVRFQ